MESEHISPKLVNSISLTPGCSGLERGITQGKFCAPHRSLVKIICKQSENFVEGSVINYKIIFSLSMRLQIVANHQDCLHYDTLALPYYAMWFQCSFHFYMIHLCYIKQAAHQTLEEKYGKYGILFKQNMGQIWDFLRFSN